jgi:hypothetical protein
MKRARVVAVALLGVFALAILMPAVEGTHSYVANMSPDNGSVDKAYARSSTGARCSVSADSNASPWGKIWDLGWYKKYIIFTNFASWHYIAGKIWMVLEAPGIADESYYNMRVLHDDLEYESKSGSYGGDSNGGAWVQSSLWVIGPSGKWTFNVTVWGLDWGSQTCRAQAEFNVVHQA